jgi:hypothetical protein
MGGTIRDASEIVRQTTVQDALDFYDAFAHTAVRYGRRMNLISMDRRRKRNS